MTLLQCTLKEIQFIFPQIELLPVFRDDLTIISSELSQLHLLFLVDLEPAGIELVSLDLEFCVGLAEADRGRVVAGVMIRGVILPHYQALPTELRLAL